ncbi:hypothetical protein [Microbulbifer sp. THAF38]|uniref:hypothetical protein n=1 Tax=Microbulbifer sp. THAF38 TaxID=2587856 RepID=UPI001267BDD0|nr:hypothetical protein [Microbulbifer sp. THAF38]QFT56075.1 hypothetical protein FIU95_16120 [Microbulbifer sp. THAF38]
MKNISLVNDKELVDQLRKTIKAINAKLIESDEDIIREYLRKYERALEAVNRNVNVAEQREKLSKLLNCARGYLEYSSCYNQDFLNEMGVSEMIVKKRL